MPTQEDAITELFEQLADRFTSQLRRGEAPLIDDYAHQHPQLAERIRTLFPLLELMEQDSNAESQLAEPAVSPPPQFERLGDFRIVAEIGRGGMGIVYQAVQESLGRTVALKLLPQVALDTRMNQRFQQEARLAAMLHHTNIVPIYGIGEEGGFSYFVMQYIEGTGLDRVLVELRSLKQKLGEVPNAEQPASVIASGLHARANGAKQTGPIGNDPIGKDPVGNDPVGNETARLGRSGTQVELLGQRSTTNLSGARNSYWQNVARIGMQVADGLAHAHAMGILHRDIKPANLLLDEAGSVWITDFGLARLTDGAHLTRTGEVVGTLRYLPPEQLSGHSDARGDIYSMGLTLYELATLQPAFPETDARKLMAQVAQSRPVAPRKIDPAIPRDLETIILKSIAVEPEKRYSSAAELAHDLRRFLEGEPIHARRINPMERLLKWSRRHPAIAGLTVAVIVLTLAGIAGVTWQWREATGALAIARAESQKRERINDFLINDFLSFADPEKEIDPDVRLRTVLDRAAGILDDRFADLPLEAAELHVQFGKIYLNLSQAGDAKQHFEQAHRLRQVYLGANEPDTYDAWHLIGIAEADSGKLDRALTIFDQSIFFSDSYFGKESPESLRYRFNRAEVLQKLGRFPEALSEIELYVAAARHEDKLDGNGALRLKADILFQQGDFAEAQIILSDLKQALEHLVQIEERQISVANDRMDDVYLLVSVNEGLGLIASNQGFYDQALEIHRDNFLLATELLGKSHSKTLAHAQNLAGTLLWSDNPPHTKEAHDLLEVSTLLSEQHLGVVHPQTLLLKNVLAMALTMMGDSESAENLFIETRQKAIGILGMDHPATLTLSQNLAAAWSRRGEFEKSEELLLETVPLMREVLGEHHPQMINALSDLGNVHRQLKKFDQAEEVLAEALGLSRDHMRAFHPELLTNVMNLQRLLIETRQFEKAEPLGDELIEGYTQELGAEHHTTINSKNLQAFVYHQQQKFGQAYPLYLDVWEFHRQQAGATSPEAVSILIILVQVEHELGKHEFSIPRLQEVMDASVDALKEDDWLRCRARYFLGRAKMEAGDLANAEHTLLTTFDAMESFAGVVSSSIRQSSLRSTVGCLAELYKRQGDLEKRDLWRAKLNSLRTTKVDQ